MKEKPTGTVSRKALSDWKRLRSLTDRQIRRAIESDPDVRPTDAEFWKKARVVIPTVKQTITIRLDASCSNDYEDKTKREIDAVQWPSGVELRS
jgi:hypothetical protein